MKDLQKLREQYLENKQDKELSHSDIEEILRIDMDNISNHVIMSIYESLFYGEDEGGSY